MTRISVNVFIQTPAYPVYPMLLFQTKTTITTATGHQVKLTLYRQRTDLALNQLDQIISSPKCVTTGRLVNDFRVLCCIEMDLKITRKLLAGSKLSEGIRGLSVIL